MGQSTCRRAARRLCFLSERENQLSVVPRESDCENKQYTQQCASLLKPCCGEKRHAIVERQNKFVCAFDPLIPRISAYEIHEWIFDTLCLSESEVVMIQIDGPKRHVYIKLSDPSRMQDIPTSTTGQAEYRHTNGVISRVRIEAVGLVLRKVRRANLPPDVADSYIRMALGTFGEIRNKRSDTWPNAYRYPVPSGIRIATLNLVQHIPSHFIVAGHRTLISYKGNRQHATDAMK